MHLVEIQQRSACLAGVLIAAVLIAAEVAEAAPQVALTLDASQPARAQAPFVVPLAFRYDGVAITALVFSIDFDTRRLHFDPADDDMDGVPDAVTLPAGMPSITYIGYDPDDPGTIDVMLANLSGAPLPRGVILEIELTSRRRGYLSDRIRFSDDPPTSFGDALGRNVEGTTLVLGHGIFADGFESGDTGIWSQTYPPGGRP